MNSITNEQRSRLWDIGMRTIESLAVPDGILASGRDEVYGCIFGRDSLITSLLLLKVYRVGKDPYFLSLVRTILSNLAKLQGTKINQESGEEPGKCIHEYRPGNHEHLTKHLTQPWYVYDDNVMRNYDTVDATPLFLMACKDYYDVSGDDAFIDESMPNIRAALSWLAIYGDSNGDGFTDYRFHQDRRFGGLVVQSWMDSAESIFFEENDERPSYPLAPVEVQAYTYAALVGWGDYFAHDDPQYAKILGDQALQLKKRFSEVFVQRTTDGCTLAAGIDGSEKVITAVRSTMGHCLWAASLLGEGNVPQGILTAEQAGEIRTRLLQPDLFVQEAGIRTLSSNSSHFEANSYHNGSIWPHDTGIVAEGLERFGFKEEATQVRRALLNSYIHFQTPVELFAYGADGFEEYRGPEGQSACRTQAWSAAALLATLSSEGETT